MAYLKQLKVIPAPPRNDDDPKISRRNRLVEQLSEQLEMAQASIKGEHFSRTQEKWVTKEDGARVLIHKPKRLRPWWMEDRAGNCAFVVRYANKPLELEKGKGAVEVGPKDKLPAVINILISAVNAGELDEMLAEKSKQRALEVARK